MLCKRIEHDQHQCGRLNPDAASPIVGRATAPMSQPADDTTLDAPPDIRQEPDASSWRSALQRRLLAPLPNALQTHLYPASDQDTALVLQLTEGCSLAF